MREFAQRLREFWGNFRGSSGACLQNSGARAGEEHVTVRDIMKPDVLTVGPQTPTLEAIELMRARGVGCLPVVEEGALVGIVTAHDFLAASARLFEDPFAHTACRPPPQRRLRIKQYRERERAGRRNDEV